MLACSFLIKSSGKLLVTRTGLKARLSSILGRIRQLILELLALEWRKFHTFELEYLWSQLANLDQILCVSSLGWGKGCIRFWGRLTLAHWTQVSDCCPLGYLFVYRMSECCLIWNHCIAMQHELHFIKKCILYGKQFHYQKTLFIVIHAHCKSFVKYVMQLFRSFKDFIIWQLFHVL